MPCGSAILQNYNVFYDKNVLSYSKMDVVILKCHSINAVILILIMGTGILLQNMGNGG